MGTSSRHIATLAASLLLLVAAAQNRADEPPTDEGATWHGLVQIDSVVGAYPSTVELPDRQVYCVYYEEGAGSSIREVRLHVDRKGVEIVANENK